MKKRQVIYSLTLATTVLTMVTGFTPLEAKANTETIQVTNGVTTDTSSATVIEIASPLVYQANENEEVGYRNVLAQGQAGQLTIAADQTVTRVEPTETVTELGTKPTVEEIVLEEPTTEYVADETKDYGVQEVVTEAKNGTQVKTTTYRIAPLPPALASEKATDDTYRLTNETFYSIDDSQKLPSDKIVIDKLYVQPAPNAEEILKLPDSEKSIREMTHNFDYKVYGVLPIEIMDADQQMKELVFYPELPSDLRWATYVFNWSAFNIGTVSSAAYLSSLSGEDKESSDIQTYHTSQAMSQGLYADVKADYLRLSAAKEQLEAAGKFTEDLAKRYDMATEMYDILTQRYNNSQGVVGTIFDYSTTTMSAERRQELEDKINQLPVAFRQNLLKLRITDDKLPTSAKTNDPAGVAYFNRRLIGLRDAKQWLSPTYNTLRTNAETGKIEVVAIPRENSEQDILRFNLRVLFHEMAHNIDYNSGMYQGTVDGFSQYGLSTSQEFKEIYETKIKNQVLPPYFRDNIEEAFAEGFARYLMKRFYGRPYHHFKEHEGEVYYIAPGEEFYDQTSSPLEDVEFYFASLYNKLFEQPQEAKVVIDTVTVATSPVQNKVVVLGTKPLVEEVVVPFTSREQQDADLLVGERKIIQVGKDGRLQKVTSYQLVDSATGEIKATTSQTVLEEVIEEIIAIGTKVVSVVEDALVTEVPKDSPTAPSLPTLDLTELNQVPSLQEEYEVTVTPEGIITAVPKDSPTAPSLPTLDLTELNQVPSLQEEYEVTVTPEGIITAVPKDSPTTPSLPTLDLTELKQVPSLQEEYEVTVTPEGIITAVPKDSPTALSLPTLDLTELNQVPSLQEEHEVTVTPEGIITAVPKDSPTTPSLPTLDLTELNQVPSLQEEHEVTVTPEGIITAVPKDSPTVPSLQPVSVSSAVQSKQGRNNQQDSEVIPSGKNGKVATFANAKLPETGGVTSLLGLLGLGLLGTTAVARRKKK
ncbi:TPA: G5 domain-containing protein [Streptococcus suis]